MAKRCSVVLAGGWCAFCYEGKKGRAAHSGHLCITPARLQGGSRWMALQRSKPVGETEASASLPAETCKFVASYPTVVEFVSLSRWPDGASRSKGTVTVFYEDTMWKAALNDKDAGLSAFCSGKTFTALFQAIEKGLAEGTLEWRKRKDQSSSSTKKGG